MHSKSRNSKIKNKKFLDNIILKKREELFNIKNNSQNSEEYKYQRSNKLERSRFLKAFIPAKKSNIGLIAEIKFASPTIKRLGSPEELINRVKQYEDAGVDAVSVITEKHYFKGDSSFVSEVKKYIDIPVLQKDFVIDSCQIYEAKKIGSDALLLIAKLVDNKTLNEFVRLCLDLDIEPVVEINDADDLEKAISTDTNIIAVNARDLETFVVDVAKACILMKRIPEKYIKLGFSGINSELEVELYRKAGAQGILVGTSLMKAKNIKECIRKLLGFPQTSVKVKICGIQHLKDAEEAIASGADFLGFIFAKKSKRSIDVSTAKHIISQVKKKATIVGVFKDNTLEEVNTLCEELNFDLVQLHGEESPAFCSKVIRPVIKAFGLPSDFSVKVLVEKMKQYDVQYYLIDRLQPGVGDMLSIKKTADVAKLFPIFFAGGLTPVNVSDAVKKIRPFAVDVITGVKINKKFDQNKMNKFVINAKSV